jgi:enamine deaminase RidA (YjgF/YER057c/UK114 family)
MTPENRLAELGLKLPDFEAEFSQNPAQAKFISHYTVGEVLYLSGCTPTKDRKPYMTGVLGDDLTVEEGAEAARQAALCYLAQIKYALGDLSRIKAIINLMGYVNSGDGFTSQPKVINGAVDLLVEVLGEKGMSTRAAVGCRGIASNASVELIMTVLYDGGEVRQPMKRGGGEWQGELA